MRRIRHLTLLSALLGIILLQSCKVPLAPEVKGVSNFKVNRKNPDRKVQFQMALEVFNPNKYKIKLKSHDLKVFLNGTLLGESAGKQTQVMEGRSTSAIRFSLQTDLKKVLSGIGSVAGGIFGGKKGVDLRVSGQVRARAKGIGKTLPVDMSKTIEWADLGR